MPRTLDPRGSTDLQQIFSGASSRRDGRSLGGSRRMCTIDNLGNRAGQPPCFQLSGELRHDLPLTVDVLLVFHDPIQRVISTDHEKLTLSVHSQRYHSGEYEPRFDLDG
jgi:hypothetical protein